MIKGGTEYDFFDLKPIKQLAGTNYDANILSREILSLLNKDGGQINWRSSGQGNTTLQLKTEKEEFLELYKAVKAQISPKPELVLNEYDEDNIRYIVIEVPKGINPPYKLKRMNNKSAASVNSHKKKIVVDINDLSRILVWGKLVDLQKELTAVLAALVENTNTMTGIGTIKDRVLRYCKYSDLPSDFDGNLRTYIAKIRTVIKPILIVNSRGYGYRLDCNKSEVKLIPQKKT